jgi:hypothetical protein
MRSGNGPAIREELIVGTARTSESSGATRDDTVHILPEEIRRVGRRYDLVALAGSNVAVETREVGLSDV